MRTGNPALNDAVFRVESASSDVMTLNGTVAKCALLLLFVIVGASFTWATTAQNPETAMTWIAIGGIGGLIFALITIFKPDVSPYTAPAYAGLEGLLLGAVSSLVEMRYPGIVFQAVGLTFGTLGALLLAYRSGLIRASENFKLGVVAATGGIALLYFISFAMRMMGFGGISFIHEAGWLGIGFSGFVVVIAALNLVLDFDFIENGAAQGAPKYMEWYGAFGLLVTLVWLYIEILRLLMKLQSRD